MKKLLKIQELTKDPKHRLMNLLRDGVKLGYSLIERKKSDLDDKNFKIFSPRLLSVTPDEEKDKVAL